MLLELLLVLAALDYEESYNFSHKINSSRTFQSKRRKIVGVMFFEIQDTNIFFWSKHNPSL